MPRLTPAPEQPSAVAGALGEDDWSELEIEALGVRGRVAVRGGGPGLLIDARQRLDDLDRLWGPTRPDSLVTEIESSPGRPVAVDDATYALVEASLAAAVSFVETASCFNCAFNSTNCPDCILDSALN